MGPPNIQPYTPLPELYNSTRKWLGLGGVSCVVRRYSFCKGLCFSEFSMGSNLYPFVLKVTLFSTHTISLQGATLTCVGGEVA